MMEQMRGRDVVTDSVDKLHYGCHKLTLNFGGSYIDSLQ